MICIGSFLVMIPNIAMNHTYTMQKNFFRDFEYTLLKHKNLLIISF